MKRDNVVWDGVYGVDLEKCDPIKSQIEENQTTQWDRTMMTINWWRCIWKRRGEEEDDFILSLSKSHEKNLLDLRQNKGQNFLALTVVQADSHSDGRTSRNTIIHEQSFQLYTSQKIIRNPTKCVVDCVAGGRPQSCLWSSPNSISIGYWPPTPPPAPWTSTSFLNGVVI